MIHIQKYIDQSEANFNKKECSTSASYEEQQSNNNNSSLIIVIIPVIIIIINLKASEYNTTSTN